MKNSKILILSILIFVVNSCSLMEEDGTSKAPTWIVTAWQDADRYHQYKESWDEGDLFVSGYNFRGIASNNSNEIIIVGQNGNIWQSNDLGLTWDNRTSGNGNAGNGTDSRLWEVEYINGNYVAVGNDGGIITSTDGITWSTQTSGTTGILRGIAYGNSTYVTVGNAGAVLTSSDSISWTSRTSGTGKYLYGVSYLNEKFIAVGKDGTIITSSDGITWSTKTSGISNHLKEVSYGNGVYVAVGTGGTIISSTDTDTWTSREGTGTEDLWAIDFGNGTFLTGGTNTYRSYDGITWDNISSNGAQAIKFIDYEVPKWKYLYHIDSDQSKIICNFCQGF